MVAILVKEVSISSRIDTSLLSANGWVTNRLRAFPLATEWVTKEWAMSRFLEMRLEADSRASSGYVLCWDGNREDICSPESRHAFQTVTSFRFIGVHGDMLARKEERNRVYAYWYGFKRFKNRIHKVYLGRHDKLTIQHLEDGAAKLHSRLGNEPWDIVPHSGHRVGNIIKPVSSNQLDLK